MTAPVHRRRLLRGVGCSLAIALGGCLELPSDKDDPGPAGPSPTATARNTESRTQAQGLGTIEFSVTNADDVTHQLSVVMENADGRIVSEVNEPDFEPGASVSAGSAGEPPESSPLTVTFRTESTAAEYVWDIAECTRINLSVTITTDGEITHQRDLCQN